MTRPFDPVEFLEQGPLVPFVMDPSNEEVLWVGPQAETLLGYPRESWLAVGFWDEVVLAEDRAEVRDVRVRGAVAGSGASLDYRAHAANGSVVWVTEVGRVVREEGAVRIHGYLLDVSERKRREVALWKSEERIRSIVRNAPDAMVVTDADGRVQDMNAQAVSLFQYELSEVVGSMLDPMIADRFREEFAEVRGGFDAESERRSVVVGRAFAIEPRDGSEIPVELGLSLVTAPDGTVQLLNSFRNLTARRRVEAQVRSRERRVRPIENVFPAMVCLVDRDERFRFVNEAYAAWYGWQRHQMEGRLVREVVGESIYSEMSATMAAALEGTPSQLRAEVIDPEGTLRFIDMSFVPQFDETESVDGCLAVFFDVGNEVRAEQADRLHREELARVARVATLGELAASIAHELNQPLSAVVANARAARRFLDAAPPDLDEVREALDDVAQDARRAGDVISSMRQLLERGETQDERVDVRSVVLDVAELVHSEAIMRGVEVQVGDYEGGDPTTIGDPAQLTQVFLNLVMNAIESTSRLIAAPRTVSIQFTVDEAVVEVQVLDNGPGFNRDDPESLFQPFVTQRSDGLGMGLTISRTITEAHGGTLVADHAPGGGALLRVRLPLTVRSSNDPL